MFKKSSLSSSSPAQFFREDLPFQIIEIKLGGSQALIIFSAKTARDKFKNYFSNNKDAGQHDGHILIQTENYGFQPNEMKMMVTMVGSNASVCIYTIISSIIQNKEIQFTADYPDRISERYKTDMREFARLMSIDTPVKIDANYYEFFDDLQKTNKKEYEYYRDCLAQFQNEVIAEKFESQKKPMLNPEPAAQLILSQGSPVFVPEKKSELIVRENSFIKHYKEFSPSLIATIERCFQLQSNNEKVQKSGLDINKFCDSLTEEQTEYLISSVSFNLIEIPVTIHGMRFDLTDLISLPVDKDGQRKNPKSDGFLFTLKDIQPDLRFQKDLEKVIESQAHIPKI